MESNKIMTMKDKVLAYLRKHPNSSIKQITLGINDSYGMNVTNAHVGVTIASLLNEKQVVKVSYGHYDIGRLAYDGSLIGSSGTVKTRSRDFAIEELMELKEKYGREELLKIIKHWTKLLE